MGTRKCVIIILRSWSIIYQIMNEGVHKRTMITIIRHEKININQKQSNIFRRANVDFEAFGFPLTVIVDLVIGPAISP